MALHDSTILYHGSTWLYIHYSTMALLQSTWLYITLHVFFSTCLQMLTFMFVMFLGWFVCLFPVCMLHSSIHVCHIQLINIPEILATLWYWSHLHGMNNILLGYSNKCGLCACSPHLPPVTPAQLMRTLVIASPNDILKNCVTVFGAEVPYWMRHCCTYLAKTRIHGRNLDK